jgi:hypothetical protein
MSLNSRFKHLNGLNDLEKLVLIGEELSQLTPDCQRQRFRSA